MYMQLRDLFHMTNRIERPPQLKGMHPEDNSSKGQPSCISINENKKLVQHDIILYKKIKEPSHEVHSKWDPSQSDQFKSSI